MKTSLDDTLAGRPARDHAEPGARAAAASWPLPLRGPRVILRALREHDLEDFRGYRSDPEVARYQGWSIMSVEDAGAFIGAMRDVVGPRPGAWIQLGIALASSDRLIGDVGLHLDAAGEVAQIGYSCATPFQRQGLASEAVRLLVDGVFEHTGCSRIRAIVDTRNIPSERLLIRLGFVAVATHAVRYDGADCVDVTYERRPADMRVQDASRA